MPLSDYQLYLTFSNGDRGTINLFKHVQFLSRLSPLRDQALFRQVFIDHGTLCWPGNIDLDPIVIHHLTMGLPIDLVHPELADDANDPPAMGDYPATPPKAPQARQQQHPAPQRSRARPQRESQRVKVS